MRVAVVGGGIVGLFTAFHLDRLGAEVTLFEAGAPGARSAHAAGIIEPTTAYRINTLAFVRRALHLWRNGTCRVRTVDPAWLAGFLGNFGRRAMPEHEPVLLRMGKDSMDAYEELADRSDDFGFRRQGLLETFDDPGHFDRQRRAALAARAVTPVEVREVAGYAGGLFFPELAWLDTDRFVRRLLGEIARVSIVRRPVTRLTLEGAVTTRSGTESFDAVAATSGVSARSLGVPLTGVRGYGWHLESPTPVERATIAVDRGIALVPLGGALKVTGGWDFDLGERWSGAGPVLERIRELVTVRRVVDFAEGSRPCTPDGLPTVGRKGNLVAANGGFRLGWSFAPAMGRSAAQLCLGEATNEPFLSRFCGSLRSAELA